MTRDLKTLMDRATDRPDVFTPDPAALVSAGRRRARSRRIATSLTALAAVVILAASGRAAVELHDPRGADPANRSTSRPQDADKLCTRSNGTLLGAEAWAWTEVVAISDQYGSASIRQAPKENGNPFATYAFCISQPAQGPNPPLGNRGGVLVRKTAVTARSSVTTVFGRVYRPGTRVTVLTGDGKTGDAVIRSEFYVYRHLEAQPWPGTMPALTTQAFDAQGNLEAVGKW